MATLKTALNDENVLDFLESIEHDKRRKDGIKLLDIMKEISGATPQMWGNSIVGFGKYHYKYDSGREGDWFLTGFSPRKQSMTIYIMNGFTRYEELMVKLGKHKTGKSCLYINKLEDVDLDVLKELIQHSIAYLSEKYPSQQWT